MILSPVQEEGRSECSVDKDMYKKTFKTCHNAIKKAKIGTETIGEFIKSKNTLKSVIEKLSKKH